MEFTEKLKDAINMVSQDVVPAMDIRDRGDPYLVAEVCSRVMQTYINLRDVVKEFNDHAAEHGHEKALLEMEKYVCTD